MATMGGDGGGSGWMDGKGGFAFDPGKAVRRKDRMMERGRG